MMRTAWMIGCLATLAMGCQSNPSGPACTAIYVFGLNVTVRDSVTMLPAGTGATVVARDGAYEETLQGFFPDQSSFAGAGERPGTYQITVTKAGYQTWVRNGVHVSGDVCHVTPVSVEVLLQPS